jgi:hypothetical protein
MSNRLIPSTANLIDSAAASARNLIGQQSSNQARSAAAPWKPEGTPGTFFKPITIEPDRWDKLYPYRLLVVDVANGNKIVGKQGQINSRKEQLPTGGFNIIFEPVGNKWEFRLPITPQQMQISTPFAVESYATLKGVVEEHGGVRFKLINFAGTMGVWPFRPTLDQGPKPQSPEARIQAEIQAAAGSSLQLAGALANQIQGLARIADNKHPQSASAVIPPAQTPEGATGTGYAQALLLDQFLEQYAELKRDPRNSTLRLVLDIPKQNQSFIVTPMLFDWLQSIESPAEIKYRMQLKAWRRITVESVDSSPPPSLPGLTPSILQSALNAVRETRRALATAYNLVRAVRSDFQTPFNALRETALFIKELASLPATVADLPSQLIGDSFAAVSDALATLDSTSFQSLASQQTLKTQLQGFAGQREQREGLNTAAVQRGQAGQRQRSALAVDPTQNAFQSPEQNFDLFDAVGVDTLKLSPSQRDAIDAEVERVSLLTVDDLRRHRQTMLDLALQISNAFGDGDDTYNRVYGRPTKRERVQPITIDEYAVLAAIYNTVQAYSDLTVTNDIDDGRIQSAMEYVAELAQASDITFDTTAAKIRVPVPFGLTIEQIAARYLGDPDRWLEIATLNALRSPYIDESGFEYPLLSNASGRQINVASNQNLYVNQRLTLIASGQPLRSRRVVNIERISDTNYLITLDGLDDLSPYTLSAGARIRGYLPGTVNSQNQIFIPSDLPADEQPNTRPVPVTKGDPLVGLSKIDWKLTESGDLALDSFAEIRLSFGMANIIQALWLKFATPLGRLIKHPSFGSGLQHGISNADIAAADIYQSLKAAIEEDFRFGALQRLEITIKGPQVGVRLAVELANGNGVVPVGFVLNQ